MSLVLTLRGENFLAVACDGRSSRRAEDGGLIPTREDCHKFIAIADDIVVGGTGDTGVCEEIHREASRFVNQPGGYDFAKLAEFLSSRLRKLHEYKRGCPGYEGEAVVLLGYDRAERRLRHLTWMNNESSDSFEEDAPAFALAFGNERGVDVAYELLPSVVRATRNARLTDAVLPALENVVRAVASRVPSSVNGNVRSHVILPGVPGARVRPWVETCEVLDGTTFKRVLHVDADNTFHISTPFAPQGSVIPYLGSPASPFAVETSTAGSRCAMGLSWQAQTIYLPDRTTIAILDSSSVAPIPPTPTGTSAVASGSLPSQGSLSVAVCYCLSGFIYGRSVSKTLTVSASQVLHVPSPSDPGFADGWIPLLASTASGGTGQGGALVDPASPLAFGTDWQEPTSTPLVTLALSSTPPISNGATASIWNVNLQPSTSYAIYPYLNPSGSLAFAGGLPATPALSSFLAMFADGSVSLGRSTGIVFTTPNAGFGAAGGGGCVRKGTRIVPLGSECTGVEEPNTEWIRIRTESGLMLEATPDHPVYTSGGGKIALADVVAGDMMVTDLGESRVASVEPFEEAGVRVRVVMDEGHLYWANGILSHNFKQ